MKILIVDDNNAKVEKILAAVVELSGLSREDFDVAFTVLDAKRLLQSTVYDLMILDFVVPFRAGDRPGAESAVALLVELRDRETLRKPRHIIGLTAFDEGVDALQPIFSQQTWTIARYAENASEWAEQLRSAIQWIIKASRGSGRRSYETDVCIVTALQTPEYEAVLRNGWDWGAAEPIDDTTFVRRGRFKSGSQTLQAVSAHSPKMGMVPTALIASKLIQLAAPRLIVMAGICAGIRNRANFGDPIVADPCWDWQSGKHVAKDGAKNFEIRPEQVPLSQELRARWEQLRGDREWWSKLRADWPSPPDTELKVRLGPSVSGSSVLADAGVVDQIKAQHGSLVGLEMESYGLLLAALTASSPRPLAFSCKAVCDLADDRKDDSWQAYAAYTSARGVTEFCERYMHELR
jgi:nucleoside phosphorylase/CheY-like chemotaxis protein